MAEMADLVGKRHSALSPKTGTGKEGKHTLNYPEMNDFVRKCSSPLNKMCSSWKSESLWCAAQMVHFWRPLRTNTFDEISLWIYFIIPETVGA